MICPNNSLDIGIVTDNYEDFLLCICLQYLPCSLCTGCPTRYRTRLAGGPLLRVATIRRTIDTHYRHTPFHFSHNERTPV